MPPAYREIDVDCIVTTLERLQRRVSERFPNSGLSKVAAELLAIAQESGARIAAGRRPLWTLRALAGVAIVAVGGLAAWSGVAAARVSPQFGSSFADILQAFDASLNAVIVIGLAIYFLLSLEQRVKRRWALEALHELRSIAHVIDMHQLTKDPEQIMSLPAHATPSSPERTLTRFQLARYLDYCSELLSMASKIAALYAQYVNDPVVLSAVNDVESLAGDLSVTVWQKTMILNDVALRVEQMGKGAIPTP